MHNSVLEAFLNAHCTRSAKFICLEEGRGELPTRPAARLEDRLSRMVIVQRSVSRVYLKCGRITSTASTKAGFDFGIYLSGIKLLLPIVEDMSSTPLIGSSDDKVEEAGCDVTIAFGKPSVFHHVVDQEAESVPFPDGQNSPSKGYPGQEECKLGLITQHNTMSKFKKTSLSPHLCLDPTLSLVQEAQDDKFSPICSLCSTKICLSNMGKQALTSYVVKTAVLIVYARSAMLWKYPLSTSYEHSQSQPGTRLWRDSRYCVIDRPSTRLILSLYSGRAQHHPCIRAKVLLKCGWIGSRSSISLLVTQSAFTQVQGYACCLQSDAVLFNYRIADDGEIEVRILVG
uniref:Uncharacterized protein n=1 Tax=Timema monikensis TaxID=170555 RepID=A0A7R9E8Y0_9NEOP|nr:unnamed protein product [Timema monikensis]